jgi:predicted metalloprotease
MSSGSKTLAGGGIVGLILLINVLGWKCPNANATFRTNKSRRKHDGRTRDLTAKELEEQAFIRTIVADNEDVWTTIFKENNLNYRRPNIVLFSGGVETACGNATSDSGPFYWTQKCIWICLFLKN